MPRQYRRSGMTDSVFVPNRVNKTDASETCWPGRSFQLSGWILPLAALCAWERALSDPSCPTQLALLLGCCLQPMRACVFRTYRTYSVSAWTASASRPPPCAARHMLGDQNIAQSSALRSHTHRPHGKGHSFFMGPPLTASSAGFLESHGGRLE